MSRTESEKEIHRDYERLRRLVHGDDIRRTDRARYARDPSKKRASNRKWKQQNPQWRENQEQVRRRKTLKLKTNLHFKISERLRCRIWHALRGHAKSRSTVELLGCSIPDFIIYIESRFEPGMTWQNYGSMWHIDHIMPCAIFDLTRTEHQKRCFHFSNMQPLWAIDNCRKSATAPDQFNLL